MLKQFLCSLRGHCWHVCNEFNTFYVVDHCARCDAVKTITRWIPPEQRTSS